MTRVLNKIVAASFMAAVVTTAAFAGNSIPSSKSTAMATGLTVVTASSLPANEGWQPLFNSAIKTSNPADLFVNVSLECGLYTDTTTTSKNGKQGSSTSFASIKVRVLIDGQETMPGAVTYCQRKQKLTATLQGLLTGTDGSSCLVTNAVTDANGTITGYTTTIDETCTQYESVGLLLDTVNANAFNFIAPDVGSGVHNIEVQTKLDASTDFTDGGSATAIGTIGKGSAVVDQTYMIKDATVQ